MGAEKLHVLMVEDNADDAALILRELKQANGYTISYERVDDEPSFKEALHKKIWDVIICDFSMPHFSAERVLELVEGYRLTTPLFLVSGKITEAEAQKVLGHRSVHEYIPKESLSRLGPVLRRALKLSSEYDVILHAWSRALALRDRETWGHSARVTELTERLARTMGISEIEVVHIRRGAMMHDVGKMGVPDSVLHKRGPLEGEELYQMRQHPKIGYELLQESEYLKRALDIPYCHHERWDGRGYPRGLKGDDIPFAARIFSVVDCYDAMTSDRPYRLAMPEKEVLTHLAEQRGRMFDPQVVDAFLRMMEGEDVPREEGK